MQVEVHYLLLTTTYRFLISFLQV